MSKLVQKDLSRFSESPKTPGNTLFYGIKRTFGPLVKTPENPQKTRGGGVTDTRQLAAGAPTTASDLRGRDSAKLPHGQPQEAAQCDARGRVESEHASRNRPVERVF